MPSASAKVEKVASSEATDAVKQIVNMFEKRVRNLEKRKLKLDNYRNDVMNGKELNEDQKIAVSKYEQVEGNLEFAKEFSKSMSVIIIECARQQKKQAKKELLERQQHEIQRLQEAFIYRHILSQFQFEDVRSDFLNGENGAMLLTSEQLSQLDQFYKLIGFGLPNEQDDLVNHFHVLAENFIFLVEGKNKEIAGTTYKTLKDILLGIKECGYFSRNSDPHEEDVISSDDLPEEDSGNEKAVPSEDYSAPEDLEKIQTVDEPYDAIEDASSLQITAESETPPVLNGQNGPLHEVLTTESSFDFLQESQIDLDAPHMDPAVVAVHQMAPPSANFAYSETVTKSNGPESSSASQPISDSVSTLPLSASAIAALDFDPTHPIPTQTFTNQSFAVMQNMIMPHGYVPVTMHHGVLPPHMAPIPVVTSMSASATSPPATVVPVHVPLAAVPVTVHDVQNIPEHQQDQETVAQTNGENPNESDRNSQTDRANENNGYHQFRGGFRGRGRGRGNNSYFRGRNNYVGRGGYQNHYYQDRNGYNGNFRRGNNRGGPRGNGNYRGRGNFKPVQQQHSPVEEKQQSQQ